MWWGPPDPLVENPHNAEVVLVQEAVGHKVMPRVSDDVMSMAPKLSPWRNKLEPPVVAAFAGVRRVSTVLSKEKRRYDVPTTPATVTAWLGRTPPWLL